MEISNFQRPVRASDLPFEKLAGNANISDEEKVGEVSRQFESVLVRQILTDAQKPMFASKTPAVSNSVYQDLMTNELADRMTRGGGLGLARSLRQELSHELKTGPAKTQPPEG